MARPALAIAGRHFGKLTAIRPVGVKRSNIYWMCRCGCGRETVVRATSLQTGATQSCGCNMYGTRSLSHGHSRGGQRRPEYRAWQGLRERCGNPQHEQFKNYGGRGIRVSDEWQHNYKAFFDHVGPRPGPGYSLDRIENDGNYEPGNVRWATHSEQQKNKRKIPELETRIAALEAVCSALFLAFFLSRQSRRM